MDVPRYFDRRSVLIWIFHSSVPRLFQLSLDIEVSEIVSALYRQQYHYRSYWQFSKRCVKPTTSGTPTMQHLTIFEFVYVPLIASGMHFSFQLNHPRDLKSYVHHSLSFRIKSWLRFLITPLPPNAHHIRCPHMTFRWPFKINPLKIGS